MEVTSQTRSENGTLSGRGLCARLALQPALVKSFPMKILDDIDLWTPHGEKVKMFRNEVQFTEVFISQRGSS